MTAFVVTAVAAALASALELFEALAIVLAVAVTRRARDAWLGAAAAAVVLVVVVAAVGPALDTIPLHPLQVVIGTVLLLVGLEWLRKNMLRLAGRRTRSSSLREYVEERDALEAATAPPPGAVDWQSRIVAFKGVLLEGVEVILIVIALGARPGGLAPATVGAAAALAVVVAVGVVAHRPLARLPETELKYVVGVMLTSFGVFLTGEGLDVAWPLEDAALLLIAAVVVVASQLLVRRMALGPSGRRSGDDAAVAA